MGDRTFERLGATAGLTATGAVGLPALLSAVTGERPLGDAPVPLWWVSYGTFLAAFVADTWLVRGQPRWLTHQVVLAVAVGAAAATYLLAPNYTWTGILFVVTAAASAYALSLQGAMALVVGQAVLIAGGQLADGVATGDALLVALSFGSFQAFAVLMVHSERREAASRLELAMAHAELRASSALLAESSRTAERLRIARELHDLVGHNLTALSLELEVASHHSDGRARDHVVKARDTAKGLLSNVRAAVGELRDTTTGLETPLRALVDGLPRPAVSLRVVEEVAVDEGRSLAVVRCVQEIVTNTLRHCGRTTPVDHCQRDVRRHKRGSTRRRSRSRESAGRSWTDRNARTPRAAGRRGPARHCARAGFPGRRAGAVVMIRVAVVDDQTLVREGIRSLLALADDVTVVGGAADGDAALALLEDTDVDVLLLDLRMPRRDGIATLEALAERDQVLPVLVLTTFDDDELVLRALRAGARGYLLKDVTLEQLISAIRTLADGGTLVQPALTDRLLHAVVGRQATVDGFDHPEPLTPRELDVLRLVAAGYSNSEIAGALHLAAGTVKNHVSSVLLKLGVRDRTRAVLRALDLGLLDGDRPADDPR